MPRLLLTASLLLAMLTPRDGLAQDAPPGPGRKLLAADSSKKTIALIDKDGKTLWRHEIGPLHDLQMLTNGNVLFQLDWTHIVEVDPKTDQIVWQYESKPVEGVDRIEVHSFQRLAEGNTMIAESGNTRIIEVDKAGKIVKTVPLKVAHRDAHRDTRLVRKLDGKHGSGHYLVAHEGDGVCREYDADGKVVWEYEVPMFDRKPAGGHGPEAFGNQLFCALRLDNGNTLIATGNGHRVLEVTPEKKVVWMLTADDLPDIELAWITTLQVMANGDIVLGNCHAGPHNPQILQVNRDKKIVWTFQDFDRFGNALANSQVVK
ncbi:MAG: PQQ-binding-like beta-propeller repeat protein [Planctomycetota bacterium]